MPRTPKRIYGPALIATGPATVYTVPALTKAILRWMQVQNPSGAAILFSFSVGADAAGTRLWDAYSIPAAAAGVSDNVRPFYLYLPMDVGEIVQLKASTNNILTIVIGADEYTPG